MMQEITANGRGLSCRPIRTIYTCSLMCCSDGGVSWSMAVRSFRLDYDHHGGARRLSHYHRALSYHSQQRTHPLQVLLQK